MAVHPEEDMRNAMPSWVRDAAGRTLPPCPRGRRVTEFVSPGAYNDHEARTARGADTLTPKRHVVRKSQLARRISDRAGWFLRSNWRILEQYVKK